MTEDDVIAHWRKGAQESLRLAKHAHNDGSYALSLFHLHLALEKALKALYMEQKRMEAPLTHDLLEIALQLDRPWTDEEKNHLSQMTEYAVAARYDDPLWAEREATVETSKNWTTRTEKFLSLLLP